MKRRCSVLAEIGQMVVTSTGRGAGTAFMGYTIKRRVTCWLLILFGTYWMTWGLWHLRDAPVDSGPGYRYIVSRQLAGISGGAGCILLGAYFLAGVRKRD
jgi:hypothetical protein